MSKLKSRHILITGGTGSFGKAFVDRVLSIAPDISRLVIFSRDELKQFEMSQIYNETRFKGIRYFLGDIRDKDRLTRALDGIDTVVHAAALKQVPAAEYNPFEFIKTNILGTQNLIEACLDRGVKTVVALSTDKASSPINLYGATKLCSDKLIIAANNVRGLRDIRFSVVRYGNVLGSRGSVVPFFLDIKKKGVLPVTHPEMTRFNITLSQGVDMVLWALDHSLGGETFVPKIPSLKILDIAKAIAPECKIEYIGIRAGEKIHEEMISVNDSPNTYDLGEYFAILPVSGNFPFSEFEKKFNPQKVRDNFSYNSGDNTQFLTVDEIQLMIQKEMKIA